MAPTEDGPLSDAIGRLSASPSSSGRSEAERLGFSEDEFNRFMISCNGDRAEALRRMRKAAVWSDAPS